ncbi:unnamed protein product, partial [Gadus morhua 'NCC']
AVEPDPEHVQTDSREMTRGRVRLTGTRRVKRAFLPEEVQAAVGPTGLCRVRERIPKRQEDQTPTAQERNLNHRASAPANGEEEVEEVEVEEVVDEEEEEDRELPNPIWLPLSLRRGPSIITLSKWLPVSRARCEIVQLQPQREQGRTHLFQLHNTEKGQSKSWTTNGKIGNPRQAVSCRAWFGTTKQRGGRGERGAARAPTTAMEGLPWDVEGGWGTGTCRVCGQGGAASEVTPAGRVPGPWSQAAACSRVRRTTEGDRGQLEERRAGSTPMTPHRGWSGGNFPCGGGGEHDPEMDTSSKRQRMSEEELRRTPAAF